MPKNKPPKRPWRRHAASSTHSTSVVARKQAIRLKVTLPDAPLPQTASSLVADRTCLQGELPPTNEKGEPLGMIAQINCADLPENDIYPATGLLQF